MEIAHEELLEGATGDRAARGSGEAGLKRKRVCKGCGEGLDPAAPVRKQFHNERCRSLYRKRHIGERQATMDATMRGSVSELVVSTDLALRGYEVFRSISHTCSCDLVVLIDGRPLRVEVKTAKRRCDGTLAPRRHDLVSEHFDVLALVCEHQVQYEPSLETFVRLDALLER